MKEEMDNLFELDNIINNNLLKDHNTEKFCVVRYKMNNYIHFKWYVWQKYLHWNIIYKNIFVINITKGFKC